MCEEYPWSKIFEYREKIHKQYPEVWDIKILRKRFSFIFKNLKDGEKVLDIGAYDRALEGRLKKIYPNILYKSMDIDRAQFHDFYSLDEVNGKFDLVLLFEVIEHLTIDEGIKILGKIYHLLNPEGRLILSTPNIFNPGRFWRDVSHKQAYCYDELAGILLAQGFEVKGIYRTYNDAFHKYLFRVYIMSPIHRYLGIDFAKSILILAKKAKDINFKP